LRQRILRFANEYGAFALTLALTIAVWEVGVRLLAVAEYVLPAPSAILEAMAIRWKVLMFHAGYTLSETLLGFFLGVAVAIPLAIAIVYSPLVEKTIYSFLVSFQAVPKVALAPLLVAWFGFSQTPKVIVVFLICFFPMVVSTEVGLRSMPVQMFQLARSLGASEWETFWKFRLPHALPSIFGGFKVAISLAVIGAVIGEFVAGHNGLGYYGGLVGAVMQTPTLYASLLLLSVIGIVLFFIVSAIEGWVVHWAPDRQVEQVQQI
jgi:NitT/TauT family transport system permease protein